MTKDNITNNLVVNYLTKEQFDGISSHDTSQIWAVKSEAAISKQQNGYYKSDEGIIVQWGSFEVSSTNVLEQQITFPVSFSSTNYSFSGTIKSALTGTSLHGLSLSENSRTSSSITVVLFGNDSSHTFDGCSWIAIGY